MLWDLDESKHLHRLDKGIIIKAPCFSPGRSHLRAAVGSTGRSGSWRAKSLQMNWSKKLSRSAAGQSRPRGPLWPGLLVARLFAGFTDNLVQVWQVTFGTH
uniref:Uncharacterized protein n=1 Tax=Moschus moschiferus TaxID=68415 RepID=A0A8C6DD58_MOSMO